jgi:hypothetical protein
VIGRRSAALDALVASCAAEKKKSRGQSELNKHE